MYNVKYFVSNINEKSLQQAIESFMNENINK